ncbi:dTDP-4-dehydrorhamnose 3,5-epimerase [Chelatococcus sp. SYSU_G07232]|uniref:dTDP-4-dehydrorhamnose 3,5-epimerase n=1 Tax=Chelatococcus albus TaxID=3047466 RepID=A0ABT7AHE7_9HYPH|nr:dTDP-4-dehydrorhamnose 3,5-epimerase [Chelatococcus sp. SYSU_G07232]MDJ1158805.1 dTDP-4-dehydrorhamnose 3,5-epimerase [Chelatococcus sp. SYSU_G07232]
MDIVSLDIPDVRLVRPRRHGDTRGWFMETWRRDRFAAQGITDDFVQDNRSFSARRGTVRGLHFQRPPHAQAKLVGALTGSLLDVVVDLRRSSPHYGRHLTVELSADEGTMLYVPVGFAHGFCTLSDATTVFYKVSDTYAPECDGGISWNDPALGIAWPVGVAEAVVSDKDRALPLLAELPPIFV